MVIARDRTAVVQPRPFCIVKINLEKLAYFQPPKTTTQNPTLITPITIEEPSNYHQKTSRNPHIPQQNRSSTTPEKKYAEKHLLSFP
jgi:hypothetical protein